MRRARKRFSSGRRLALAACMLSLAPGCRPGSSSGPQVLLGGGRALYVDEPPCSGVPIIFYTQGGYHVWASVRARNINMMFANLHFTMINAASGATINTVDYEVNFDPIDPGTLVVGTPPDTGRSQSTCPAGGFPVKIEEGAERSTIVPGSTDGWGEALALPVIAPEAWWRTGCPVHACLDGLTIRVRVDLTDADGRTASDERLLVASMTSVPVRCMGGDRDAGIVPVDLGGFVCP